MIEGSGIKVTVILRRSSLSIGTYRCITSVACLQVICKRDSVQESQSRRMYVTARVNEFSNITDISDRYDNGDRGNNRVSWLNARCRIAQTGSRVDVAVRRAADLHSHIRKMKRYCR